MANSDIQQSYAYSSTIVSQPQFGGPPPGYVAAQVRDDWIPQPMVAISNCPPGLEYLMQIDQLLVHQQIEILEILTGFETNNKYVIKNSMGQKVFFAAEDSTCCQRCFCSNIRDFQLTIIDNFGHEVIHLNRPLACQSCLYPCCLQKMEISAPPGTVIGSIEQNWSLFPSFDVKDASGETVLKIKGPFCPISCCGDVEFHVYSRDGETKVGKISKQWGGLLREAYTDADNFGINFPMDLDVKMKAVMLGACFLIDFMYFEDKQDERY